MMNWIRRTAGFLFLGFLVFLTYLFWLYLHETSNFLPPGSLSLRKTKIEVAPFDKNGNLQIWQHHPNELSPLPFKHPHGFAYRYQFVLSPQERQQVATSLLYLGIVKGPHVVWLNGEIIHREYRSIELSLPAVPQHLYKDVNELIVTVGDIGHLHPGLQHQKEIGFVTVEGAKLLRRQANIYTLFQPWLYIFAKFVLALVSCILFTIFLRKTDLFYLSTYCIAMLVPSIYALPFAIDSISQADRTQVDIFFRILSLVPLTLFVVAFCGFRWKIQFLVAGAVFVASYPSLELALRAPSIYEVFASITDWSHGPLRLITLTLVGLLVANTFRKHQWLQKKQKISLSALLFFCVILSHYSHSNYFRSFEDPSTVFHLISPQGIDIFVVFLFVLVVSLELETQFRMRRRYTRRLEKLTDKVLSFDFVNDRKRFLQELLNEAAQFFQARRGSFILRDPQGVDRYTYVFGKTPISELGKAVTPGSVAANVISQKQKPIDNVFETKTKSNENYFTQSFLAAPLNVGDKTYGHLFLADPEDAFHSVLDQEYLEIFCHKMANEIFKHIQNQELLAEELEEATDKLAHQFAHDIKSPLAALQVSIDESENRPKTAKRLVDMAVQRIRDISFDLDHNKNNISVIPEGQAYFLIPLLESFVYETSARLTELTGCHFEFKSPRGQKPAFIKLPPNELKNTIESLLDNAQQASPQGGVVSLELNLEDGWNVIQVRDHGKGIPSRLLPKLGFRGATFDKEGHDGMGLFNARTTIENAGGKFSIASVEGSGTTVTLKLPQEKPPQWLTTSVDFSQYDRVVAIDDDPSVIEIWATKLSDHPEVEFISFNSPTQFTHWYFQEDENSETKKTLYLVDLRLGPATQNGLMLIEEMQLQGQCLLVTSQWDDEEISRAAKKLDTRILPKSILHLMNVA